MKDYTYAQKDAFVKKMQIELDELNVELTHSPRKLPTPVMRPSRRPTKNRRLEGASG